MSTSLERIAAKSNFDRDDIELIKDQIAVGASDRELALFVEVCSRTGLNPLARQIYAIKRGGKMTFQTSIDGQRLIAERSGRYEGQTPAGWCDGDGVWVDVWLKDERPAAARVGVYKKGHREPIIAVATWREYGQTQGLWGRMPAHMLAKCAESLALKKAFPQELSGLYTTEEMPADRHEDVGRLEPPRRPEEPVSEATGSEPRGEPAPQTVPTPLGPPGEAGDLTSRVTAQLAFASPALKDRLRAACEYYKVPTTAAGLVGEWGERALTPHQLVEALEAEMAADVPALEGEVS